MARLSGTVATHRSRPLLTQTAIPARAMDRVRDIILRRHELKISARNQIKGIIKSVTKGQTTAHVQIEVDGAIITASITNEAVDALALAAGKPAYAVIKASDVMIAVD